MSVMCGGKELPLRHAAAPGTFVVIFLFCFASLALFAREILFTPQSNVTRDSEISRKERQGRKVEKT